MLPFIAPKLQAIGYGTINDMTFPAKLDRAVARSDRVRSRGSLLIEDQRLKPRPPDG
jgi:hypothetical protein